MRIFRTLLATFVLAHSSPWVVDAADTTSPSPKPGAAQPVQIIGLDNAFRVSDNIYSGSQPETDATFAALAKLGVKTIVSVDGSKPDVERAHRYGLHYVHVPFGYGGIPTNRVAELVKAVATKPGPFYVHCHHGMHRGPAAVAVICENNGTWSPSQAVAWLHQAGTSQEYPGLFRAASEFRKPTDAELAAVKSLPETAASTSLVDAMVAVDEHFSWLKA
ncbi:MAG: sulfur transferase domain-containing protein, partial [Verrucomicrobiota bacterium]